MSDYECRIWLVLRSDTYDEAIPAYKMEYIGSVLFYIFFCLFVVSYFTKRVPDWIFYCWAGFELVPFFCLWEERLLNPILFGRVTFRVNETLGYRYVHVEPGFLYLLRYSLVAGDFSVRIPYFVGEHGKNEFDIIIKELNHMTAELAGVETLRTDLITNILKLNRLENQQIYPDKKSYNLTEQLCECLLGFEYAWEKKKLEIETDMEEEVYVCEDAELLSLVWNNLLLAVWMVYRANRELKEI